MCNVSCSFCGTILVTGDSSTKAVSKHVLGGRNCFMIAVVVMSGDNEYDIVSKVEWPLDRRVVLEVLLFCKLLVASGGRI